MNYGTPHAFLGKLRIQGMVSDKPHYSMLRSLVILKPLHDSTRYFRTRCGVSVIVIYTILINRLAYRLPAVMKQHRQPQDQIIFTGAHSPDRVLPYCNAVMGIILNSFHLSVKLRENHTRNTHLPRKPDHLRMR